MRKPGTKPEEKLASVMMPDLLHKEEVHVEETKTSDAKEVKGENENSDDSGDEKVENQTGGEGQAAKKKKKRKPKSINIE